MVHTPTVTRALLIGLAPLVALAQQTLFGQCGGIGWSGPTQCVAGSCCQYSNDWYSQCLSGNCSPATTTQMTTVATSTTPGGGTTATGSLSSGCGKNPTLTSGTKSITVNGKTRQYILRVPNNYDKSKQYKLIFCLHWLGGTMTDVATGRTMQTNVWDYYGLRRLANENAIFVAPQGLNNGWANSGGEDLTFIDAMIRTIESDLCVNQRLRFATGFSYGGAMSYSIACSRAKDFRAVAVLSGGLLSGCSGGSDPIAYLGIHGVRDNVLGGSGGRSLRDKFVANNGCTARSPPEPAQGSLTHVKTVYSGCKAGYPVTWIAFDAGHIAAPHDGGTGDSGTDTFSPVETWNFFNQLT